jgi:hypothetical protein
VTTEIEKLPLFQVTYGTGTDEDFYLPVSFTLADGLTPVPVTGLTFNCNLGYAGSLASLTSVPLGGITFTSSSSILVLVPAARGPTLWSSQLPGPGAYVMTMTATDGVNTRDVFQSSSYQLGAPQPPSILIVSAASAL